MKLMFYFWAMWMAVGYSSIVHAKDLKTEKNKPVVVLNLVNVTTNCQSGPIIIPDISQRPTNGVLLMQPRMVDVPQKGECPARKVPAITILYSPKREFTGTDVAKIAIQIGEKRSDLDYRIFIGEHGQKI